MPRYADIDTVRDALYEADAITMKGVRILNQFPTVSPDEVRGVGKWEHQELAPTNWTFCSVCGRQRSKKYKWYYCPNCGAKMEVSERWND